MRELRVRGVEKRSLLLSTGNTVQCFQHVSAECWIAGKEGKKKKAGSFGKNMSETGKQKDIPSIYKHETEHLDRAMENKTEGERTNGE